MKRTFLWKDGRRELRESFGDPQVVVIPVMPPVTLSLREEMESARAGSSGIHRVYFERRRAREVIPPGDPGEHPANRGWPFRVYGPVEFVYVEC